MSDADKWDERYSAEDYVYGKAPNDFLAAQAHRIPRGRVLCLGEGEGRNAVFLAEQGHEVIAVDGSRVGGRKTRALAAERGVTVDVQTADLDWYALEPEAWSGIVSIFCHLPPEIRVKIHHAVVHGLAPGGVFILEAYTPAQLAWRTGGPPTRRMLYTLKELRDELDGLELAHAEELERDIQEGRFHTGRGAVVQIVGIKPVPQLG